MRLPSQNRDRSPVRFNITPLIDVVFLLIIFFLVASHFVRNEKSEAVELPVAGLGRSDREPAPHRLTVTIQSDGGLSVNGVSQTQEAINGQIQELAAHAQSAKTEAEIRIRADRRAAYRHVRRLIERCSAVGIRSIRFAVISDASR